MNGSRQSALIAGSTMTTHKRQKPESLDDYCDRILRELAVFYEKHYGARDLSITRFRSFVEPAHLSIQSNLHGKDDGTLYRECLLPKFVDFASDEGIDFQTWDRKDHQQPFEDGLRALVAQFQEEVSPIIFHKRVYFLRLEAKPISGLPHDKAQRMAFLEMKPIFSYEFYSISETDFFRLTAQYVNLWRTHSRSTERGSRIGVLLFLAGFALSFLLLWGHF